MSDIRIKMIQRQIKFVIKKIPIIINSNLPSCINCSHFIEDKQNLKDGKCKLFGQKDIITGKIDYLYSLYCREDEQLCGKNGMNYNPK